MSNITEKELEEVKRLRKFTPIEYANLKAPAYEPNCDECKLCLEKGITRYECKKDCEVETGIRLQRTTALMYFTKIKSIQDDATFYELFKRFDVNDIIPIMDDIIAEKDRKSKEWDEQRRDDDWEKTKREWEEIWEENEREYFNT